MIVITSLSPSPDMLELQKAAVESWIKNGLRVISMNGHEEVKQIMNIYPDVEFVPTFRTFEFLWGKPYVSINAMLDWAKQQEDEHIILINSDIVLSPCRGILDYEFTQRCLDGICLLHRRDVEGEAIEEGKEYIYGMDVFLIHKKLLSLFPQSIYCMGQTWWDFWIAYSAIKKGVKVFRIDNPIAYHQKHKTRWSDESWQRMSEYFAWEHKLFFHRTAEVTCGKIWLEIQRELNRAK